MKQRIAHGLIYVTFAFFLIITTPVRADVDIYWDFDDGFYPSTVTISPGEAVTWWNVDPYGFDVHITVGGSLSFDLEPYSGQRVIFPFVGNYGFSSNWGDNGSVTVSLPPPPEIALGSPRIESGQLLIEVSGLTVGKTIIMQASTNLVSWTAIQTNVATTASLTFTNATVLPRQFFRLMELP